MSDLAQRLRTKADMIHMGERIAWGSETALMRQAADVIQQQRDVMRMARDAIDKMRYHASMVMMRENGAEACGMIEVIAAPAADALDAALKGSE